MYSYQHKYDSSREVLAVQVTPGNVSEVAGWCGGTEVEMTHPVNPNEKYVGLNVPTATGNLRAFDGDYVVHDKDGNFHVRTGRIFEAKYVRSENQDQELEFNEPEQPEMKTDDPWGDLPRIGTPDSPGNNYVSPPDDETPTYTSDE